MRFPSFGLAAVLVFGLSAAPIVHAQSVTVYSNVATFTGLAYANGGTAAVNGINTTVLVADDITTLTGSTGDVVTSFSFSLANLNPSDTTASPTAYFYDQDATTGGPGTLLAVISFDPITQSAGDAAVYAATNEAGFFTLPSETFWAGLSFRDTTGLLSRDTLDSLGQGFFDPPTVGSSQDLFFRSADAATAADDPAGSLLFFNSGPVANFGWKFETTAAPEPPPTVSLSLAVLGLVGLAVRACRRSPVA